MFHALNKRDKKEGKIASIEETIKTQDVLKEKYKLELEKQLKAYGEWLELNEMSGIRYHNSKVLDELK